MEKRDIKSVLKLDHIVFDKIVFERQGFQNENEFDFNLQSNISQRDGSEIYRCTLLLKGRKPDEYTIEISLTGFFVLSNSEYLSEAMKYNLVSKNTVAILMPYLRSEVSLLTAQPNTDTVVLPVFNVNNMIDGE